jgi:hypothetical protein
MRYDDAVASLFQAPLEQFVAERKRLAAELKTAGDKAGAAKLAKLARPPISAWAVDQLWWHARAGFEALFETAQRLRDGKLDATAAHRDAIAKLRARAAQILADAEHGATEATLRRITQTLAALAASGSWDPDPPGALSADRDPPGFEAVGISLAPPPPPETKHEAKHETKHEAKHDEVAAARERRDAKAAASEAAEARRRKELDEAAERAEEAARLRRAEADRAKAAAERHRYEAALRTAKGDVAQREREVARLEKDLTAARDMVDQARAVVEDLEARLSELEPR